MRQSFAAKHAGKCQLTQTISNNHRRAVRCAEIPKTKLRRAIKARCVLFVIHLFFFSPSVSSRAISSKKQIWLESYSIVCSNNFWGCFDTCGLKSKVNQRLCIYLPNAI